MVAAGGFWVNPMQVENVRVWQWMLIGVLVGLLFAAVKVYQGPWFVYADTDTLSQARFERAIIDLPEGWHRGERYIYQFHKDQPLIKEMMIHPPLGGADGNDWWVTGKCYSIIAQNKVRGDAKTPLVLIQQWIPFKYPAPAPYKATNGSVGTYPNILDYLAVVKKHNPSAVPWQYAWWTKPNMPYLLLPIAGLLILGFAWPATLAIMQHAGLARRREKRVKLAPNRTITPPAKPQIDTAAAKAQLDDLNADLEASLQGFGGHTAAPKPSDAAPSTTAAPVAPLPKSVPGEMAPSKPPEEEEGEKDYGGEFYPVARSATHKK